MTSEFGASDWLLKEHVTTSFRKLCLQLLHVNNDCQAVSFKLRF